MSKKNAVLGAGPLGFWVAKLLAERGDEVVIVNRKGKLAKKPHSNVKVTACDITDSNAVAKISKGADAVFHCAMPPMTMNWEETLPPITRGAIEGVARAGAKLIYGDNLFMYGAMNGRKMTEKSPSAAKNKKGRARAVAAETILDAHKKGKLSAAIGRASDLYGPMTLNSAIGEMFFSAALKGKAANLLGNVKKLHSYTYIKDFANALIILSDNEKALGKVWHVPNAETLTTENFVELIEKEIGKKVKIQAAGKLLVSIIGLFNPLMREFKEMMYEFDEDFVVDSSSFEKEFGIKGTPLKKAIKETTDWFRNNRG